MVTLAIISVATIILGIFYIVGFWNAKVAGRVDVILFTILNLRPKKKHVSKIPKKIKILIKILVYKRNLFLNKLEARRRLKNIKKLHKKTAPK